MAGGGGSAASPDAGSAPREGVASTRTSSTAAAAVEGGAVLRGGAAPAAGRPAENDWFGRPAVADPNWVGGALWAQSLGDARAQQLLDAAAPGGALDGWVELARRRADSDGAVVFTAVTGGAANDLLLNWLVGVTRNAGLRNFVVAALDDDALQWALDAGAGDFVYDASAVGAAALEDVAAFADAAGRLGFVGHVWLARYHLTAALVSRGLHVLQCDLDAVVLHDPLPALKAVPADVVAQRGVWPKPMAAALGHAACGGFSFFRGTRRAARLLREGFAGLYMYGDDQSAVAWGALGGNDTPGRAVAAWSNKEWSARRGGGGDFAANERLVTAPGPRGKVYALDLLHIDSAGRGRKRSVPRPGASLSDANGDESAPLALALLPFSEFPRRECEATPASLRERWVVPHCMGIGARLGEHSTAAKIAGAASIGLWWMPLSEDGAPPGMLDGAPGRGAGEDRFLAWMGERTVAG